MRAEVEHASTKTHAASTERRGCGFTQATRHLAVLVNRPLAERREVIAKLFPDWAKVAMRAPLADAGGSPPPGGGLSPLRQVLRDRVVEVEVSADELERSAAALMLADANAWLAAQGFEQRVRRAWLPWRRSFEIGLEVS